MKRVRYAVEQHGIARVQGCKVLTPCRAFETSAACRTCSNRLLVKKAGFLDRWLGVCQADAAWCSLSRHNETRKWIIIRPSSYAVSRSMGGLRVLHCWVAAEVREEGVMYSMKAYRRKDDFCLLTGGKCHSK